MFNLSTSSVNIHTCENPKAALEAANMEASSTGANVLPAIMFKQGQRLMLTTAFPVPVVRNRLQVNAAERRGNVEQVRSATNRPTMPDHVDAVKGYLKENIGGRYIIPPMTLNVRNPLSVYAPDYQSHTLTSVFIVLPVSARLEITDGGHRKAAIDKVSDELIDDQLAEFDKDAVAVMITVEEDLAQIHQDFADCSKTKALPKSQLAAYDRRNPANGLVLDIIEQCDVFKGKIDSTSQTLSIKSPNLFLTNQVRQMVKALLVGDYAMADDGFEEKAKQLLGSAEDPRYSAERDRFIAFVRGATAAIPVWKEIASLPEGTPRNRITDFRNEGWVCLTATGLIIIGSIGHDLFKNDISGWENYTNRLGDIDWRRTAPMWQTNIIQQERLLTQRGPVKGAIEEVRKALGLDVIKAAA